MSSTEFWLPERDREPSLYQRIGNCGLKEIREQFTWRFSKQNFFLGLGGVPESKWFSVSPLTVPLQDYNVIEQYKAQFEIPESTEYFISPPQ